MIVRFVLLFDYLQGAIESISVGEIKLSLRQSLVKLGVGFISRDPKLQILICDLEVTMRPSIKGRPKSSKPRRPRNSGRGKWMVVGNIARYLSVSVTDLVLKVCKVLRLMFAMFFMIFYVESLKPIILKVLICLDLERCRADYCAILSSIYISPWLILLLS